MAEGPASPGGGSHESGGDFSPRSSNVPEQDRFLPIANISRIMKKGLPANGKMAKDAKETVQECVSEFISFMTSEASDKCQREKRKTINGDDLLWAMATLGFEDYIEPLKLYLNRYREMEGDTKGSAKGQEGSARKDGVQLDHNALLAHQGSYLQGLDYGNSQAQHMMVQMQVMMPSATNWFDLPFELKSNILSRIGPRDIIENAQEVCKDWFNVCKDPSMWKVTNMANSFPYFDLRTLTKMSKYVVNRSQGQLVDIVIPRLPTDEVLLHVAERSSQLKRLTMTCFLGDPSIKSLAEALKKFPLLEELIVYSPDFLKEAIESAGRYCPLLKTLIVDQEHKGFLNSLNIPLNDEIAVAVGENLQGLTHLKLIRNGISNNGLKVLMDGCRQLESLDLSLCWNIDLKEDIVKRCSEQIKRLTLPHHDACGSTQSDDHYDPYNPYYGELAYADGGLTESDDDDLTGLYTNYYTL